MLSKQTCKVCGSADGFDFHVPDMVWSYVVPAEFENRVVCLSCFDNFAHDKGVDYGEHIDVIYFAGEQECFRFEKTTDVTIVNL